MNGRESAMEVTTYSEGGAHLVMRNQSHKGRRENGERTGTRICFVIRLLRIKYELA